MNASITTADIFYISYISSKQLKNITAVFVSSDNKVITYEIYSWNVWPPMSTKADTSPPILLRWSIVAMALPAPFEINPILPFSLINLIWAYAAALSNGAI